MDGYLFLSYSRRQFYFIEALLSRLQDTDISLWADIGRLKPGQSWEEGIRQGLNECAGLLLIASRDALSSSYVQEEWQTALQLGKAIYVIVFEPVELPAALQSAAAILVFQGDLSVLVSRLIDAVQKPHSDRDLVPKPNRFGIPRRLPRDIWLVAAALISSGALLMMSLVGLYAATLAQLLSLDILSFDPVSLAVSELIGWSPLFVPYTVISILFYYQAWLFLRRRVNYYHMRLPLPLAPFLPVLSVFYWFSSSNEFTLWRLGFLLLAVAVGVLDYFVFFHVSRHSEAVFYWLPTGEAPDSLRSRYRPWLLRNRYTPMSAPGSITYRLHYAPADRAVADQVHKAFQSHSVLKSAAETAEPAHVDLLILSGQTPYRLIGKVLPSAVRPICLVASRIRVPEDFNRLVKYQWVDFRKRSDDQLFALADHLDHSDNSLLPLELTALPETLDKILAPPRIMTFFDATRMSLAVTVVLLIFNLVITGVQLSGVPFLSGLLQWSALGILFVALAFEVWLMLALIDRRISHEVYLGLQLAGVAFFIGRLLLASPTAAQAANDLIGVGLGTAVFYYFFYRHFRAWLPRRARRTAGRTLRASHLIRNGLRDTVKLTVILIVYLTPLMLAASDLATTNRPAREVSMMQPTQTPSVRIRPNPTLRPVQTSSPTRMKQATFTPLPTLPEDPGWVIYTRTAEGLSIALPAGWYVPFTSIAHGGNANCCGGDAVGGSRRRFGALLEGAFR